VTTLVRIHPLFVSATLVLSCWGCGGDSDRGPNAPGATLDGTCDDFAAKFTQCDLELALEAPFGQCTSPGSDVEECTLSCLNHASCENFTRWFCNQSGDLEISDCIAQCAPAFVCTNGDEVPWTYECDDFPDCVDRSDEHAGCKSAAGFTCGDGRELRVNQQCDAKTDCSDGSDEQGCAYFRCDDGSSISSAWECDFFIDCADGADEHAGCSPNPFTAYCDGAIQSG